MCPFAIPILVHGAINDIILINWYFVLNTACLNQWRVVHGYIRLCVIMCWVIVFWGKWLFWCFCKLEDILGQYDAISVFDDCEQKWYHSMINARYSYQLFAHIWCKSYGVICRMFRDTRRYWAISKIYIYLRKCCKPYLACPIAILIWVPWACIPTPVMENKQAGRNMRNSRSLPTLPR